jgi:hypothetical protein
MKRNSRQMRTGYGVAAATLILTAGLHAAPTQAGLYQDDLSRCLVAAAKPEDRDALLRWIFAAMASNPKIRDMAKVSQQQSETLSKDAAGLMQRLILEDCRKQTIDAIKYEGAGAIQNAFGTLGQIAMSDLMREESTNAYMGQLDTYLDRPRWDELGREAGVKAPASKP